MTIEYLRYTVDESRGEKFVDDYRAAAEHLTASRYCRAFELCRCDEDPTKFILRIEWTSAEDHMQGFRKSDDFRRFFVNVKPYLDDIDEMRHYSRLI